MPTFILSLNWTDQGILNRPEAHIRASVSEVEAALIGGLIFRKRIL